IITPTTTLRERTKRRRRSRRFVTARIIGGLCFKRSEPNGQVSPFLPRSAVERSALSCERADRDVTSRLHAARTARAAGERSEPVRRCYETRLALGSGSALLGGDVQEPYTDRPTQCR